MNFILYKNNKEYTLLNINKVDKFLHREVQINNEEYLGFYADGELIDYFNFSDVAEQLKLIRNEVELKKIFKSSCFREVAAYNYFESILNKEELDFVEFIMSIEEIEIVVYRFLKSMGLLVYSALLGMNKAPFNGTLSLIKRRPKNIIRFTLLILFKSYCDKDIDWDGFLGKIKSV